MQALLALMELGAPGASMAPSPSRLAMTSLSRTKKTNEEMHICLESSMAPASYRIHMMKMVASLPLA